MNRRHLLLSVAGLATVARAGSLMAAPVHPVVLGVIEYGQSNSEAQAGKQARLLRTDYPFAGRLWMPRTDAENVWLGMATTGGRSYELAEDAVTGLMPLRGAMGSASHGTTAGESMVLRLCEDDPDGDGSIVLFNAAEGGQSISNLGKNPKAGHFAFQNLMRTVKAVNTAVQAEGKAYVVRVLLTAQGESNAEDTQLGAKQETVRHEVETAIQALTGQSEAVWMLSVQPSSFFGEGKEVCAILAEHERSIAKGGAFFCLGPTYNFPFYSDFLHHTSPGHDMRGELYAIAYESLVKNGHWEVLRGLGAQVQGPSQIVVTLTEPAQIDTKGPVYPVQHAGITLTGGEVEAITLKGDKLLITTKGAAAAVTQVRLGLQGHGEKPRTADKVPRTNIRSVKTYGAYRDGSPIHKWFCHQVLAVKP